MKQFELSLLEIGIIAPGQSGKDVLAQTFRTAELAEQSGYSGLWLGEHHEAHFCWAAPEVMLASLAQRTSTIKLGSAAVLLPLYSPLSVAENYRTLAAMTDGRVALGVCGGVPADQVALSALTGTQQTPADICPTFGTKVQELTQYLHGNFAPEHRFANGATPCFANPPELWLMGSGYGSAELAAKNGAGYAYSMFHRASRQSVEVTNVYRQHLDQVPQNLQQSVTGKVAVAVSCVCAESEVEAKAQKQLVESLIGSMMCINICGTPEQCHQQLLDIQETYQADNLIIYHMWHLEAQKRAAIIALSELFNLKKGMNNG